MRQRQRQRQQREEEEKKSEELARQMQREWEAEDRRERERREKRDAKLARKLYNADQRLKQGSSSSSMTVRKNPFESHRSARLDDVVEIGDSPLKAGGANSDDEYERLPKPAATNDARPGRSEKRAPSDRNYIKFTILPTGARRMGLVAQTATIAMTTMTRIGYVTFHLHHRW